MDSRCPRKLNDYPSKPCELGRKEAYQVNNGCKTCPWGVKSKKANHCMWLWLTQNPGENTDTKISEELGVTTQRVGQVRKRALKKIKENFPDFYRKFSLFKG